MRQIILLLCIILIKNAYTQPDTLKKNDKKMYFGIYAGLVSGEQTGNRNLIKETGFNLQYYAEYKINNQFYQGISVGIETLSNTFFLPVGTQFHVVFSGPASSLFVDATAGYAFAENRNFYGYDNYDYKGGLFAGVGIGYQLIVKSKRFFLLRLRYKLQNSKLEYETPSKIKYIEKIGFNLFFIEIGMRI